MVRLVSQSLEKRVTEMNLNDPLVSSVFTHLTDPTLPRKLHLVVAAPSFSLTLAFSRQLVDKLSAAKVDFSFSKNTVKVGKRQCKFIIDEPKLLLGMRVDYLFLSDVEYMRGSFTEFVDNFIRPFAIVIQTGDNSSLYSQEIPHK